MVLDVPTTVFEAQKLVALALVAISENLVLYPALMAGFDVKREAMEESETNRWAARMG